MPKVMKQMLEEIDAVQLTKRISTVADIVSMTKNSGAQLIVDHRISDGQFAILVSPGDFALIKEKTNAQD